MAEKLTALLITYNEEENIREYLDNFSFADEIIVVDSYSEDSTAQIISTEFPHVKFIQREFINFSDQKNFTLKQATHPWCIFFDADERIDENLKAEIIETIQNPDAQDAYFVYRRFYFMDKFLKYSGWQNDKAIRLFKTGKCCYDKNKFVHETMNCTDKAKYLKNKLDHYSYITLEDYNRKLDLYAELRAKELFQKGVKPNILHFIFKPSIRFLHHYLFGLGFLDGKEGFMISKIYGDHVFKRYVFLKKKWKESSSQISN